MKKGLLFIYSLPLLAFTSCLDSDMSSTQTVNIDMVNRTVSEDNSSKLSTAKYRFDFDFTEATVDITAYDTDIYFSAYTLQNIPLSASAKHGYTFRASNITPVDGNGNPISNITFTEISGQFYNTLDLRYVLGNTVVVATPTESMYTVATTTTATPGYEEEFNWDESTYYFEYKITSESLLADMTISNIKFDSHMPTQQSMTFPNLKLTPTAAGLKLTADELTPLQNNVPYPDYKVTDFEATINPNYSYSEFFSREEVTASFTCMGKRVTVKAYMYDQDALDQMQ